MRSEITREQLEFLEQLVIRYGNMLTKRAYRFFGYQPYLYQIAEDAVQDTFVKAFIDVETVIHHPNPAGWLTKALKHTLLNKARDLNRQKEELYADVHELPQISQQTLYNALERWYTSIRIEELKEAVIDVLTEDEKATFHDHFIEGWTTDETAAIENVSSDTVRGRISRIRKKLRNHLE